jgi:hypothetical protein
MTHQDSNNQDNYLIIKLCCLNARSFILSELTGKIMIMNVEESEVIVSLAEYGAG